MKDAGAHVHSGQHQQHDSERPRIGEQESKAVDGVCRNFFQQGIRDQFELVRGNPQGHKDEEHARNEEHAEPERQGEDHQQLDDLRQRDAPRRVEAIAEGSACQRGAEVVADRIAGQRGEGHAGQRNRHLGITESQVIVEDEDAIVDDRQTQRNHDERGADLENAVANALESHMVHSQFPGQPPGCDSEDCQHEQRSQKMERTLLFHRKVSL